MIAKETLYLTADRQSVVKEGDPKAQYLLVREGMEISDAEAEKYGVKGKKAEPAAEPAAPVATPAAAPTNPPAKAPAKAKAGKGKK